MSTLNENILKVKETFEDIASAIEEQGVDVGDCDSPTTYASKIRSIVGSGGGLDPNKLYVEAYDAGDANPTVTASSSDDGGVILTFGLKRGAAGTAGAPGKDGRDGKDGADGAPGPQGPAGATGQDGADGMDGSVYEYIYFRGVSEENKPNKPSSGIGNNIDDYVPTEKNTVNVNGNSIVLAWSDKAQGVDEIYKFEWRSERKKSDTNTWGDFTTPILWAKYGEKGKDGDGVQYIFTVTEKNSAPNNPTPTDWETNSGYQNNEAEEYIPSGWADDPIEVDATNKYCWTSVRKYRNGKWGRYSDPTTWTKWVESSGTVTADVVVIDMDPDFAMVNSDDNSAETTITAFRGDDPVIIQDVTCESGDYTCNITSSDNNKTWKVVVSNIQDSVSIKVNIKLSETSTRTKTFSIYHTKNDSETVSVDFGDDNILVPCSDGSNPDAGFFNNLEIPVMMKVAGQSVTATSIVPDSYSECFEITSAGNIKVKSFPGNSQKTSVKFTVSDGANTADGYVNFTKFNTAGGTIAMYTLNINANDIVCDTRNNVNEYKVYSGKQGISDNKIKALVNKYSSKEGNTVIEVSALPSTYAVYYANDPEDWSEDASSTIGEYLPITDNGIEIGNDIAPDKCVSFQLREWIGQGTPWSDMSEGNYKVWDSENILVDIIRDIASYQFVITPNKIHRNVNSEITVPENKQITVGLSKNKAGDGETKYEALSVIPTGYDIYYEIDNNGDPIPFGGESENVTLPYTIDVSDVTNSIVLTLVVNENSDDDKQVVLSETVEITSDVPGKSAYVGYLTDPMCTVSCDANGVPTDGQIYDTTFKVTNGTVTNVTIPEGNGYTAKFENGKVYFKDFTQNLPEVTNITLIATYEYSDGIIGEEEAGYTIVKLKVADASTILDFSNDNIVIPCDENGTPYTSNVSAYVAMLHGDDVLTLTSDNVILGERDKEGYYKITFSIDDLIFDGDVCNKELTFTGTDGSEYWTRKGQLILTKLKAGESGKIWDLVLTTDSPKYDNATDKFDDDYIEGWVNIWGADSWEVASYNVLTTAGRYIVYKTDDDAGYTPMKATDFEDGHFKLYINSGFSGKTYVDLDSADGVKIALAKLEDGQYIPIQEEIMRASFDGRDFGKFELMLSDEIISRHINGDGKVTYNPTEIKINGIFEYSGMDRTQYEKGQTHNKHIAGLDVYYSKDHEYKGEKVVDESWMYPVGDIANNGIASDDVIPVDNASEYINVYLVAHYKEGDNPEELRIIDNKLIRVISTADGTNGIGTDGNGIVSITKRFAVNNDPKNHPTGNWTEDMPLTSSENRYLWCEETTTYTKSNPTTIHYIVAVHGEPGAGGTGNDAPIIYPAGVWDDEKTYISVASDPKNNVSGKVPYVFYASEDANEGYYVLKEGATPPIGTVPTNTTYWDPIDSFEAIYADIGLFNQALVGKWVFHGDYMFSQEGIGYKANNNTKQTRYDSFSDPSAAIDNWYSNKYSKVADKDWFKPNVCFNAITGESVLGKSTFDTNSDTIGNKVTIDGNVINIANSEGTAAITLINDSIKHKDLLIDNTKRTFDNAVSNVNLHLPTNAGPIDCYLYYRMHKIGYIEADSENPVTLKVLSGSGILTITDFDDGAVWSGLSSSTIRIICVDDNGTKTTVKTMSNFGPIKTTSALAKGQERGCTWTTNSISLTKSGTYYIEPWIKQQFKWTKESSGDIWGNFNIDLSVSLDYTSGAENKLFIGNDGIVTASAYGFSKLTDTDAQMIFDTWGFAVSSNGIMFTKDGGFVWNKLKFNDNGSVSWEQTHWEGNSWSEVENNTPSNGTASSIGMWD